MAKSTVSMFFSLKSARILVSLLTMPSSDALIRKKRSRYFSKNALVAHSTLKASSSSFSVRLIWSLSSNGRRRLCAVWLFSFSPPRKEQRCAGVNSSSTLPFSLNLYSILTREKRQSSLLGATKATSAASLSTSPRLPFRYLATKFLCLARARSSEVSPLR